MYARGQWFVLMRRLVGFLELEGLVGYTSSDGDRNVRGWGVLTKSGSSYIQNTAPNVVLVVVGSSIFFVQ